jgi:trigger factor
MSVVQSIQDIGPCKKELKIEVPAEAVDAETERVTREYGRQVRIPGFRPGKVPAGVVRKRFGEEIQRDVVEHLVPRFWQRAQSEAGIDPITPPQLAGVEDRETGEPLVFTARVEVRPEVEIGDLSGFDLPDPASEPTDEEVERTIEELRGRAGAWVEVDRPAGQGDRVTAEIEETTGEEQPEEKGPETVQVEVGAPEVWEELSLALSGLSTGQKGEFDRMHDEEGVVRERRFRFQVSKVEARELPELDDALAKRIGGFETVDELETAVREQLAQQKAQERNEARENALLDQLRARYPLDLPEGLIDQQNESMVREYAESLARQGVDVRNAGIDWKSMAEQARPAAEARVHARLLLEEIAKREGIEVGEAELDGMLTRIGRPQGVSAAVVRRTLSEDGRLEGLRAQMLRAKTVRHLLGEEGPEFGQEAASSMSPDAAIGPDAASMSPDAAASMSPDAAASMSPDAAASGDGKSEPAEGVDEGAGTTPDAGT